MLCPTCTDERLAISDRSGIEIDYCPRCRGVWLDRGELDKLIERSAVAGSAGASSGRPWSVGDDWNRSKHDPGVRKHKRKGFLDELFDF